MVVSYKSMRNRFRISLYTYVDIIDFWPLYIIERPYHSSKQNSSNIFRVLLLQVFGYVGSIKLIFLDVLLGIFNDLIQVHGTKFLFHNILFLKKKRSLIIIMNQSKKKMKKCFHDSLPRTSLMFNKSFVTSKYQSLRV